MSNDLIDSDSVSNNGLIFHILKDDGALTNTGVANTNIDYSTIQWGDNTDYRKRQHHVYRLQSGRTRLS